MLDYINIQASKEKAMRTFMHASKTARAIGNFKTHSDSK